MKKTLLTVAIMLYTAAGGAQIVTDNEKEFVKSFACGVDYETVASYAKSNSRFYWGIENGGSEDGFWGEARIQGDVVAVGNRYEGSWIILFKNNISIGLEYRRFEVVYEPEIDEEYEDYILEWEIKCE